MTHRGVTLLWQHGRFRLLRIEEPGKERCYEVHQMNGDPARALLPGVVCVTKDEWNKIAHQINRDWRR